MSKKIKFALLMKNGMLVRTLNELKNNFDLGKIIEYHLDGKLIKWLSDRNYSDEMHRLSELRIEDASYAEKLSRIFGQEYEKTFDNEWDDKKILERIRKRDLLQQYTDDNDVIQNTDKVAMNSDELKRLLEKDESKIYLFNNIFDIPLDKENIRYIGIGGNVRARINSYEEVDFKNKGISFENVMLDEEFSSSVKKSEVTEFGFERELVNQAKEKLFSPSNRGMKKTETIGKIDLQKTTPVNIDHLKYTAQRGNCKSMRKLGDIYINQTNYDQAIYWYKKALRYGDNASKELIKFCKSKINSRKE